MKLAIVLFNLGGPDSPQAVEPFLRNLFSDKAIIGLPGLLRLPLARFIAGRRAPIARDIYARIGGRSPIVPQTQEQATALEAALAARGHEARCFIAMRYWHPFSDAAAKAVKDWGPEQIVLLPLYPQFSTTTTQSSLEDWKRVARRIGLDTPSGALCCYPQNTGFASAAADQIARVWAKRKPGVDYRLLLSAHGLPKRTVSKGDPYQWQVEKTAQAIVDRLGIEELDWQVCYQSRVGPLEWIGPATDNEIRRAGADGKALVVAPIAFVSEHSETLVELDIEYAKLAREAGVIDYLRAPVVGTAPAFIEALADLALKAAGQSGMTNDAGQRICPQVCGRCIYQETVA